MNYKILTVATGLTIFLGGHVASAQVLVPCGSITEGNSSMQLYTKKDGTKDYAKITCVAVKKAGSLAAVPSGVTDTEKQYDSYTLATGAEVAADNFVYRYVLDGQVSGGHLKAKGYTQADLLKMLEGRRTVATLLNNGWFSVKGGGLYRWIGTSYYAGPYNLNLANSPIVTLEGVFLQATGTAGTHYKAPKKTIAKIVPWL